MGRATLIIPHRKSHHTDTVHCIYIICVRCSVTGGEHIAEDENPNLEGEEHGNKRKPARRNDKSWWETVKEMKMIVFLFVISFFFQGYEMMYK